MAYHSIPIQYQVAAGLEVDDETPAPCFEIETGIDDRCALCVFTSSWHDCNAIIRPTEWSRVEIECARASVSANDAGSLREEISYAHCIHK